MQYEYQVLESDSEGIPADMLNEHGKEGWQMTTALKRDDADRRWIFYFMREKQEETEKAK
jgi:hypothetical protein